jgi:hypothetical protein
MSSRVYRLEGDGRREKYVDWLTRPADWLLSAGGFIAGFFSQRRDQLHGRSDDVRNADAGDLSVPDRILANAA